jgi:TRAP-type C4-dicarboxylate transport system substrate-binding protein
MSRTSINALAGAALFASANLALAQAPIEMKYASSSPPKTVWAMQTERFVEAVNADSKGQIKITAFIGSQLGSEQDTIQQVARGRIEMGGYSITAVSLIVPELSVLSIPFYYKSSAEQDCVYDTPGVSNLVADMLAKKGLQFLSWSEVGITHFFGKKPILTPADIRGVKARSQPSKIGAYIWTTFGANPNPLPVTEWNSAMQTGLVEVADASPTYYHFAGLGKIAPVMTLSSHQDLGGLVVMNKAIYDKLTTEQKAAIDGARKKFSDAQLRAEVRGFEEKILEMHKAGGGQVVAMTDAQRDVWRMAIEPQFAKIVADVGGESAKLIAAVEAGLKTCRKPS